MCNSLEVLIRMVKVNPAISTYIHPSQFQDRQVVIKWISNQGYVELQLNNNKQKIHDCYQKNSKHLKNGMEPRKWKLFRKSKHRVAFLFFTVFFSAWKAWRNVFSTLQCGKKKNLSFYICQDNNRFYYICQNMYVNSWLA